MGGQGSRPKCHGSVQEKAFLLFAGGFSGRSQAEGGPEKAREGGFIKMGVQCEQE